MKIFLGLIMALTFLITFILGSICNGLIRYPALSIDYYFSFSKMLLNVGAAVVFTGIFIFLTPVFKNIALLKKAIVGLAAANSVLCCVLPFLIYSLSSQTQKALTYNYYNWLIIVTSLLVLIGAIYINRLRKNDVI